MLSPESLFGGGGSRISADPRFPSIVDCLLTFDTAPIVPKVMNKPKPVAMIVAKAKRSSKEYSPDLSEAEKINHYLEEHIEKSPSPGNGCFKRQKSDLGSENIYYTTLFRLL
jgi:hypothetical protein